MRTLLTHCALGALAAGLVAVPALAQDTVKIGFAVPLTGDFAPYNEVDGARCMAEMINRDGGVGAHIVSALQTWAMSRSCSW